MLARAIETAGFDEVHAPMSGRHMGYAWALRR